MKKLILMVVLSFSIGIMCVEALASPNTGFGDGYTPTTPPNTGFGDGGDCPLAFLGVPCGTTPAIPTRSGTCEVVPTAFISGESDSKEYELNKPIVPTYYANDKRLWIPFVEYKGEALVAGAWLALDDAGKFDISSISEFDKTKNCMPKEAAEEKVVYVDKIVEVPSTEGKYSGVWKAEDNSLLYLAYEKDGYVIISSLPSGTVLNNWEVYEGKVSGNTFTGETSYSGVRGLFSGVFTSDTRAVLVQEDCWTVVTGYYCLYPNGTKSVFHKVR